MDDSEFEDSLFGQTKDVYKKAGDAGRHGSSYEEHIILLALVHCVENYKKDDEEFKEFRICTQNDNVPRAFDDVIIERAFDPRNSEYKKCIFIQAKHAQSTKSIALETIFSKYFQGYLDLREKFNVEHVIFYTNKIVISQAIELVNNANTTSYSFLCSDKGDVHKMSFVKWKNTDKSYKQSENGKYSLVHKCITKCGNKCKNNEKCYEEYDESDFLDFFSHFLIISKQPDQEKLLKKFNKAFDEFSRKLDMGLDNYSSSRIKVMVDEYYSSNGSKISYLDRKRAMKMIYTCFSDKIRHKLDDYNKYDFIVTGLDKGRKIHLSTKATTLYVVAICKHLEMSQEKYLIANNRETLMYAISAFELEQYVTLVIFSTTELNIEKEYLERLKNVKPYKKIIVIGSEDYECVKILKKTLKADSNFRCVIPTKDTLSKILNKSFTFQGQEIPLSDTLRKVDSVDEELLDFIIQQENISIGPDLPAKLDTYMNRYFCKDGGNEESLSEIEILKKENKFIVLSGLQGEGKSTTLAQLSIQLKNLNPHMLVINCNFKDIVQFVDKENVLDLILMEQFKKGRGNENSGQRHEEALFHLIFRHTSIALILDGIEDIQKSEFKKIINMVQKNSIEICIASSTLAYEYNIGYFGNADKQCNFYTMKPLTKEEGRELLTQFWQIPICDQWSKVNIYAEAVINLLLKIDLGIKILKLPLHIRMISEIFETGSSGSWESLQQFLRSNRDKPQLDDSFDMLQLYKEFIEGHILRHLKKYNIACIEKDLKDCVIMFSTVDAAQTHISMDSDVISTRCNTTLVNMGKLIENDINLFKSDLKHRNISEYLVVKNLVEMLWEDPSNKDVARIVFETILSNIEKFNMCNFINSFFEKRDPDSILKTMPGEKCEVVDNVDMLKRHTALGHAIQWGHSGNVKYILKFCPQCEDTVKQWESQKPLGPFTRCSPLMLATYYSNLDVVRYLVEEGGANVTSSDYCGNTALHYAAMRFEGTTHNVIDAIGGFSYELLSYNSNNNYRSCFNEVSNVISYLVKNDANINAVNVNNFTALELAIICKNIVYAEAMINHDPTTYDKLQKNLKYELLHLASSEGNLDVCKFVLSKGANIHSLHGGKSLLYCATQNGHVNILNFLIDNGASVDFLDEYNRTLLHIAVMYKQLAAVEYWLEHKDDVNAKDCMGKTPLHYASKTGNLKVTSKLIQAGALLHLKDFKGKSAMHYAAERGDENLINALIEANAPVDIKDNKGCTPLHYAAGAYDGRRACYLLIDNSANILETDNSGKSIMHYAAESGNEELINDMIEAGVPVDIKDEEGCTPWHYAAEACDNSVCYLLIDNNANVLETDNFGKSAMHYAVEEGNVDLINSLIKASAPVDIKDNKGCTPLHYAALADNASAFYLLIDNNANIVETDNSGKSAMHYAAERGNDDLINELVKASAPVDIKDNKGCTPLHYAAGTVNYTACYLLIINNANILETDNSGKSVMHYAAESGNKELIKDMIEVGFPVDVKDDEGCTPLHYAAGSHYSWTCYLLIDNNANVLETDNSGKSVMHYAVKSGNEELINYMIRVGVPVDIKDDQGCTPLHYAAEACNNYACYLLIDNNANVLETDNSGKSAMHYAAEEGNVKLIDSLIKASVPVDIKDNKGCTPLHYAAVADKFSAFYFLIDNNANIVETDNSGKSVMHYAVKSRNKELINYMIRVGVPVDIKDDQGCTPLHYAAAAFVPWAWYLLINNSANILETDNSGKSAMHYAAKRGDKKFISPLIEASAPVDIKDNKGRTPLHYAAGAYDVSACYLLINNNANILETDDSGKSAIHYAAQRGNGELINALIQACAPVDIKDNKGCTPLHYAAGAYDNSACYLLINNNANILETDDSGKSTMHYAAERGNVKLIKALIKAGAPVDIKDLKGCTPLHYAAGSDKILACHVLIDNKANVLEADNSGKSIMHYAAERGNGKLIKALIKAGAPVDIKDLKGCTPLHYAAGSDKSMACHVLIDSNANILETDNYGKSIMDYAPQKGNTNTILKNELIDYYIKKYFRDFPPTFY